MIRLLCFCLGLVLTLAACNSETSNSAAPAGDASATNDAPATPYERQPETRQPVTAESKTSGQARPAPPTQEQADAVKDQDLLAILETSRGTITLELFANDAPLTVANFKNLADMGYYNGITFHRVIPDFMVQGGDPDGSGMGGPGYKFADEPSALKLAHDSPGTLSMANAGPNTNGSQFFITHVPTPHLNGKHAVFGKVVEGQDVVDAIRKGDTINTLRVVEADTVENDQAADPDTM